MSSDAHFYFCHRRDFENAGQAHESGCQLHRSGRLLPFRDGSRPSLSLFSGRFENASRSTNEFGKVPWEAGCANSTLLGVAGVLPLRFYELEK